VFVRHRLGDAMTLAQALGDGFYEPPEPVRRVVAASGAKPRVVDLGAHLGFFGLRTLSHWPDARIVAWEPEPDHARIIRRCIAANGRQDGWSVVEACAATADGQVPFRGEIGAASHVPEDPAIATTTVLARDVFPDLRDAALVKMDIEGSEWALLADERFATIRPPALLLEWHGFRNAPPDPRAAVTERLEGLGYTLLHSPPDPWGAGMLWAWRA
jgi:FkbM family methyltransferase